MPGTNSLCELQNATQLLCVYACVCLNQERLTAQGLLWKRGLVLEPYRRWIFRKREIQTLPTQEPEGWNRWHLLKTGFRHCPAVTCTEAREGNLSPQMQGYSPDLFCFLFLNMKE